MKPAVGLAILALLGLPACGADKPRSAAELQACVKKRLPPGAVDHVVVSTEEGVTSINYYRHGTEIDVSVFPTAGDAVGAEKAEARLGDAHDRRLRNVLYSGGGIVEAAVVACVR